MLKCIGAAMAFCLSTAIGIMLCEREKARLKTLGELCDDMNAVRFKLRYAAVPLGELLEGMGSESTKQLWAAMREGICGGRSAAESWDELQKCGEAYACINGLNADEKSIVGEFMCELGTSDKDTQLDRAEISINKLREHIRTVTPQINTSGKLYVSLGITLGLAGALMLI